MKNMQFQNPFVPQNTITDTPRWKGIIRGYYLAITYWKGFYLKSFISREEYEASDLPVKENIL